VSDLPSLPRTLRQGRYLRLTAVCLLAAVVCALAGVWQYHRWHGKHATNAELRASAAAAPVPVGDLLAVDRPLPPADRFRTVTARGSWDAAGELYVRQRQVNSELAFLVVTPLRTDDGRTLLVVRGWQPATGSATQRPPTPAPPAGPVEISGRAYPAEHGGLGATLPDRQIQRIDTAAIGSRLGTAAYDGYVELVGQRPDPGTLPVLPAPDLANPAGGADEWQHLAYVAQWFCFALLALVAPFLLAVLERRDAGGRGAADRIPAEPEPDGIERAPADRS
jgi:cytochrome oxidase assembly protein ShyY1